VLIRTIDGLVLQPGVHGADWEACVQAEEEHKAVSQTDHKLAAIMEREAGSASPGYASGLKRSCGWVTANTGASFSTFSLTTAC
jgi:hypothetical protein